jgi:hypothetical protein
MAFSVLNSLQLYSAGHGFWPVEEIAELADKPTGFSDVERGACLLEMSVWQGYLYLHRHRGLDQTQCCQCISDFLLACCLKILPAKTHAVHYTWEKGRGVGGKWCQKMTIQSPILLRYHKKFNPLIGKTGCCPNTSYAQHVNHFPSFLLCVKHRYVNVTRLSTNIWIETTKHWLQIKKRALFTCTVNC